MAEYAKRGVLRVVLPRALAGMPLVRAALKAAASAALLLAFQPLKARSGPGPSPAENRPAAVALLPGTPAGRELLPQTSHAYEFELKAGQFFLALLEKRDLNLSATVYEPGGRPLREFVGASYGPLRVA